MEDIARQIFDILDRKKWKNTHDISNELDMVTFKFLPILIKGISMGIFSYDTPHKWKLCKKADQIKLESFCDEIRYGIDVSEKTISKFYNHSQRKTTNKKTVSKNNKRKKLIKIKKIGDGFNSGKKKLYDGPLGQYFSDPNYEKRYWE